VSIVVTVTPRAGIRGRRNKWSTVCTVWRLGRRTRKCPVTRGESANRERARTRAEDAQLPAERYVASALSASRWHTAADSGGSVRTTVVGARGSDVDSRRRQTSTRCR